MSLLTRSGKIPVDVVFSPKWWHKKTGICFDRGFFFGPKRRVKDEAAMEEFLCKKWGPFGLVEEIPGFPNIGAVHMACGYVMSEMLGCEVTYCDNDAPTVIPRRIEEYDCIEFDRMFKSQAFVDFDKMVRALTAEYGGVSGDVNWSGVLNLALDLRGEDLLVDMLTNESAASGFFDLIAAAIERFTGYIDSKTGTTSISVNRNVRNVNKRVFLHSECSTTMISVDMYRRLLQKYDMKWAEEKSSFGIHYCGVDPHRFADAYAELPKLDFLDLGYGGDVAYIREKLPLTFLNIRLSPVKLITQTKSEIKAEIKEFYRASSSPKLTGFCCINIDDQVSDEKIDAIFEAVSEL